MKKIKNAFLKMMRAVKNLLEANVGVEDTKIFNLVFMMIVGIIATVVVVLLASHCWIHNYIATVTEPTCTTWGYTTYVCSRCGETYVDDYVSALGHDYIENESKEATCEEIGWNSYISCSRCDYTTIETIEALGHSFTNYVYNNDATCTKDGTKTAKCDVCGKTETVSVDNTALGHSYGEFEIKTAATVDHMGIKSQTCSRCGDVNCALYDVPTEYKNALKKAESYSRLLSMSKRRIYSQLTSEYGEGFSADAAQYAVDNMKADWNANALEKAKTYRETLNMSKTRIYNQLVSEYGEKFTASEAQYAIDHLDD